MDVNHRELDHIRRRSLDWSVNRVPLRCASHGIVERTNVPDISAAPSYRLDVAAFAREVDGIIHVFADPGELFEILIDDFRAFPAWNAQALGQAKGRNTVSDPVVHHFRLAAHF